MDLPVISPSLLTLNVSFGVSASSVIFNDLFLIVTSPPMLVTPSILVVTVSLMLNIELTSKAPENVTLFLNSVTPSTITLSFKKVFESTVKLDFII